MKKMMGYGRSLIREVFQDQHDQYTQFSIYTIHLFENIPEDLHLSRGAFSLTQLRAISIARSIFILWEENYVQV
jgi:hypothetical protein